MSFSGKMDKSSFKIVRSLADLADETTYWVNKTPQERIEAVEYLRQQFIQLQNLPTKIDKTFFAIRYGK